MFHTSNNLIVFYRIHSMTLRTAQALYTLASLRPLHTILMTTHWDSINMTGKFYAHFCPLYVIRVLADLPNSTLPLIIKSSHSQGEHATFRSKVRV